ncbi:MAG: transcription elongation factor GreA [Candidatus Zixiibacteriota bacterium]
MTGSHGYIYLSPEGYKKLLEELKRLKTVDRPQVVAEISRARDLGDLSENAEYHAAKERQVLIERKISDLEFKMGRVKVLTQDHLNTEQAFLLSFVRVKDIKTGEEIRYQLVSPEEADIDEDRISVQSPIGRGLLGKSKGERVQIQVPAGVLTYDIIDIELPE